MQLRTENGKIYALLKDLRLWPKNPRIVEEKDLTRLENQIKDLGIYKPLVVTPDGEVLGGNQRFKILTKLQHEWVWVSIVEAWTDKGRLKYCLSDNDQIGKYTREQVGEVLKPFLNQKSLFSDYALDLNEKKELTQFIDELCLDGKQLEVKEISKKLESLGVDKTTIDVLKEMIIFNKQNNILPEIEIKGEIKGQKYPLLFWLEDETLYEQLKKIFNSGHKNYYSTEKLIYFLEKHFNKKFPTDVDTLIKILEEADKLTQQIKSDKELSAPDKTLQQHKEELLEKIDYIKRLYALVIKE